MLIRSFEPKDIPHLRRICCETADNGRPVESIFPDRELIADFWTDYYIRYEPGSLWIAEKDNVVIGYLTGCLNEKRFMRVMTCRILPGIIKKNFHRAIFWTPFFMKFIFSNAVAAVRRYHKSCVSHFNPQGHFHINLMPEARGEHAGQMLIERFKTQAKAAHVQGLRIGVREDNAGGRIFFEKMGFKAVDRRFAFRIPGHPPTDFFAFVYDLPL